MQFILPDLLALCPFPFSTNPHYNQECPKAAAWIDIFNIFPDRKRAAFMQTSSEALVAHAYPYAGYEEFQICCDFVNLLFVVDEISDDQSGAGARATGQVFLKAMSDARCDGSVLSRITKIFRARLFKKEGLNWQRRFLKYCSDYIEAVSVEAELREQEVVLDLESFTRLRRENSAVRPCFGLVEFILGIDLPDEVFSDPVFERMYFAAVDMLCWSNDLYSYNMEQATGHTGNNIVTVLMRANGYTLQEAADAVGHVFGALMHQFVRDKAQLQLRWGARTDDGVCRFVTAMEHWVVGNLVWSFETQRYFGAMRHEVKRTRVVTLKPRASYPALFVVDLPIARHS